MFSEKNGYIKEKDIQFESISDSLRKRIWNVFYCFDIQEGGLSSRRLSQSINGERTIDMIVADRLGFILGAGLSDTPQKSIQKYILNEEWYRVYDFIETHLSCLEDERRKVRAKQYNEVLEQEKAGYRVVDGEVVSITNVTEIEEIEQAVASQYDAVNIHIKKALKLYSDREKPDYENSIKESISAVESICCIITGLSGTSATLGKTITKLKDSGVYIHPAMEKAFSMLYGYTSDESGIRHGNIDFKNANPEDAKYMLVTCCAFVNFLIEKWVAVSSN